MRPKRWQASGRWVTSPSREIPRIVISFDMSGNARTYQTSEIYWGKCKCAQAVFFLLHSLLSVIEGTTGKTTMAAVSPSVVKHPRRLPPGPKGHFLLGNLAAVSRDWLGFYAQCAREYGDVVHLRYLHVPICLLMHPRDIEYVLVTNTGNFTKSADYRALARVLGTGLLTNEGEFWKRQRGLIQPAFHRQNILAYAQVMTEAAGRMLDSWKNEGERNIHDDLMGVTLQIVAQCLYGAEVSGSAERVG